MRKTLGWLLLFAGVIIIIADQAGLLATLTIDTTPPQIWGCYPTSTKEDSPTPIWGGIKIYADLYDESDIASASVEINGDDGYSATYDMAFDHNIEYGSPKNPIICERWSKKWTVPSNPDVSYTFTFTASDTLGHTGTESHYGYATTGADGYFTINGEEASAESHIVLDTRTVTFEFIATSGAETITMVNVGIEKDGWSDAFYLTKETGTTWVHTYVFGEDGTYTVKGYFHSGGESYERMSLFCQIGEGDGDDGIGLWTFIGLGIAFFGVILIVTGKKEKVKKP